VDAGPGLGAPKSGDILRCRQINAQLVHGINALRIERGSIRSSAGSVEAIAHQLAKERLGHIASGTNCRA
jgi:hypothetical protein